MPQLPPEPPIADDDTQPVETASPYYRIPPGPLQDIEDKLRGCWSAFEQLLLNGFDFRIREDLEVTYKQVAAERIRRDLLIDPDVQYFSLNDEED